MGSLQLEELSDHHQLFPLWGGGTWVGTHSWIDSLSPSPLLSLSPTHAQKLWYSIVADRTEYTASIVGWHCIHTDRIENTIPSSTPVGYFECCDIFHCYIAVYGAGPVTDVYYDKTILTFRVHGTVYMFVSNFRFIEETSLLVLCTHWHLSNLIF